MRWSRFQVGQTYDTKRRGVGISISSYKAAKCMLITSTPTLHPKCWISKIRSFSFAATAARVTWSPSQTTLIGARRKAPFGIEACSYI